MADMLSLSVEQKLTSSCQTHIRELISDSANDFKLDAMLANDCAVEVLNINI